MELSENGLVEETTGWTNFPPGSTDPEDFLSPWWNTDSFPDDTDLVLMPHTAGMCEQTTYDGTECPAAFDDSGYYPLLEDYATRLPLPFPFPGPGLEYSTRVEEEDPGREPMKVVDIDVTRSVFDVVGMGYGGAAEEMSVICTNSRGGSGTPTKKSEGHPSKNLMAERRRRKRLNDRLSMLRSIVPKISKMDRTSILGDTIDYMKELLERINKLQEQDASGEAIDPNPLDFTGGISHNNDVLIRNSPKFHVDRRELSTRIDICCATRPGLLLSTVNTLEALGLELQQCVISCFGDFSMQASCSEEIERRSILSQEDIKQALFRNAGYGGTNV